MEGPHHECHYAGKLMRSKLFRVLWPDQRTAHKADTSDMRVGLLLGSDRS